MKTRAFVAEPNSRQLEIADLLRAGKIRPVIVATYDLSEAQQDCASQPHIRGKVVLTVGS